MQIAVLGEAVDLTYKYEHLGSDPAALARLLSSKPPPFIAKLKVRSGFEPARAMLGHWRARAAPAMGHTGYVSPVFLQAAKKPATHIYNLICILHMSLLPPLPQAAKKPAIVVGPGVLRRPDREAVVRQVHALAEAAGKEA